LDFVLCSMMRPCCTRVLLLHPFHHRNFLGPTLPSTLVLTFDLSLSFPNFPPRGHFIFEPPFLRPSLLVCFTFYSVPRLTPSSQSFVFSSPELRIFFFSISSAPPPPFCPGLPSRESDFNPFQIPFHWFSGPRLLFFFFFGTSGRRLACMSFSELRFSLDPPPPPPPTDPSPSRS